MAVDEFRASNRLTLLRSGAEYFPALQAAIAAARHFIHLETYIFADDSAGRLVARALMDAAASGVTTRVIVDDFGAKRYFGTLRDRLLEAGVEVLMYRPDITPWNFRRSRLRR